MTTNRDIDAAKDRLVESLNSARDVTITSVREDIGPAVAAAVEAALEASGPAYAEAASRAGGAVNAIRASDTVNAIRNSDTAQAVQEKARKHGRRWPIAAAIIGVGATAFTVAKRRNRRNTLIDLTDPDPAGSFDEVADARASDLGPDSA